MIRKEIGMEQFYTPQTTADWVVQVVRDQPIDLKRAKYRYDRLVRSSRRQDRKDVLGNAIECRLTFEQWLKVWLDSGHYHEMGAGKGKYVLSRRDDIGHYEEGNVFVQSHSENVRQSLVGKKRDPEIYKKMWDTRGRAS